MIVSIGKKLSPGEETRAAAYLSPLLHRCQTLNSTKIHARPTQQIQRQKTTPVQNTNLTTSRHCSIPKQPTKKISPPARQESALSAPQLHPTLGRNQQPRVNQSLNQSLNQPLKQHTLMRSRSRRRRRGRSSLKTRTSVG